jgi:hypothetical protein
MTVRPPSAFALRRAAQGLAVALTLGALYAALVWMMLATRAEAHDALPTAQAPLGWTYPLSCCSNYDCRQVTGTGGPAGGEVREGPDGYVIAGTGEVVPYRDKRVRRSPDGEFHWCAHQAGADAGRTICLFVPDRGF